MDGREQKKQPALPDAADERQYMLSGDYEVYEKVGSLSERCRSIIMIFMS